MSPEEKEQVIEDLRRLVESARILYRKGSESREHAIACLQDRIIEIKQGRWDDD